MSPADPPNQAPSARPEAEESLWRLAVSPTLWALHFLLSYACVAVWCGKLADPGGSLEPARRAVLFLSVLALAGIGVNGWGGVRRWRAGSPPLSRGFDTDEDRHRFLGHATVLLSALSAVATAYVTGAVLYFQDCR